MARPLNDKEKHDVQRMLNRAMSLKGRDLTKEEREFRENPDYDKWDYFQVFGLQPETQQYIDETIRQLNACEHRGHLITCRVRLGWSIKSLKGIQPKQRSEARRQKSIRRSMAKTAWKIANEKRREQNVNPIAS